MTHPVGQKLPNPWGLYDIHGHVSEWCQDWYGPYHGSSSNDPQGPATGSARVVHGGNWNRDARYLRSAFRLSISPDSPNQYLGFRAVLAPGQP